MEGVVLAMACLGPWALGAVELRFEFLLDVGVLALMILWGADMILRGRAPRLACPAIAGLAALVLLGVVQMIPMPGGLLGRVAPGTAGLYSRLLPETPETLPSGERRDDPIPPAGSTLSFYPGATRTEVVRMLGLVLLFAAIVDAVASAESLRRLGLAAMANGSLLALFGLIQLFSSDDPRLVYWSIPTGGQVFGPYVNRNHFAFFQNMCVGLAAGVLLARTSVRSRPVPAPVGRGIAGRGSPLVELLRDPWSLGMMFALALMASSVIFSLSRGGFVALLGGALLGLAVWAPGSWRSFRIGPIFAAAATAAALACWFGYEQVADRLATLHGAEVLDDRRLAVLRRSMPLVRDFPLWGTGYGTFEFADMLHRADAVDAGVLFDHAHDDYLELLVEGGAVGLVACAAAIALILGSGVRAARGSAGDPNGGLALGASIGLVTALIHSFADFGLHMPANAVMATVLAAHVRASGRVATRDDPGHEGGRLAIGPISVLAAVAAVALGGVLVLEGARRLQAHRLWRQAYAPSKVPDAVRRARTIAALEAAARFVPQNALLQAELASAYLDDASRREVRQDGGRPDGGPGATPASSSLVPALRHLLRSRDLCPLRAEAHMDLAANVGRFALADPRAAYLDRAKLLAPDDPDLWYRCGEFEVADGHPDRAWQSWRRSLELSNARLAAILDRAAQHLGPSDLLDRILPDDPARLIEAASYVSRRSAQDGRPYQEKALALLERRPAGSSAEEAHLRATLCRSLGRPAEALDAYRAALALEPFRHEWRLELAEALSEQGRFQDARQELLTVLGFRPGDGPARRLLDEATRKVAEGK